MVVSVFLSFELQHLVEIVSIGRPQKRVFSKPEDGESDYDISVTNITVTFIVTIGTSELL